MVLAQNRHKSQWNKIEDHNTNPYNYNHLILTNIPKILWKKDKLFKKWCWENRISTRSRGKLHLIFSTCTSINSKWIKDLNVRSKTVKLIQKKIENTLEHISISNYFMNGIPITQQSREIIDK
jgi:hypothetical protein